MGRNKLLRLFLVLTFVTQLFFSLTLNAYAIVEAPRINELPTVSTNNVVLNWNGLPNYTYQVWRKDYPNYPVNNTGSEFQPITITALGASSYTDTTVSEKKKYQYKLVAVEDSVYYSDPSNIVEVYTDISNPSAPGNLELTRVVNGLTLNWTRANDNWGIAKYNIYYRQETGGQSFQYLDSSTTTTFSHRNLSPNITYVYYVTAVDYAQRESDPSNQRSNSALADTERPSNVAGLTATAYNDTRIDLSWSAATDNSGSVSYVVYKSAANTDGNYSQVETSDRNYSFTGLTNGARYYFKVWAKDAAGNVSLSPATANTIAQNDTVRPTPPTIWARAVNTSKITLTFKGANDNKGIVSYEIFRGTGLNSTPTYLKSHLSTSTDVTIDDTSSILPNNTYKYYVKVKDAAGNTSEQSNTFAVITNGDTTAPTKPQNLRLTLNSNTEVRLAWDSSSDSNNNFKGYKIYRSVDSESYVWINTGSTLTSTSYTDSGLTQNKNYSYKIAAYDTAGNESSASDSQSIYTSTTQRSDEQTISSSSSGTLSITDLAKLEIPTNAYNKTLTYKMTTKNFSSYTNSGYKTFGQPVEITAKAGATAVTSFDKDLKINFYYTSSELGSTETSKLGIYYWDDINKVWVKVPSTVSSSSRRVTAEVDHFTVFALLADTTAPTVPTISNSNSATKQDIELYGKAENNAKVEIGLNNSTFTVNADAKGNYKKLITLNVGRNDVKVRAEDAAGNRSDWSSVYVIYCNPAVQLTDISGHWAEQNILKVLELGVTSGYEDRTFRPNRTITRAEFSKFVVSALGYSPVSNPQLNFRDNATIPSWSQGFVARAVEKGLIAGYSDNTFRANQEITRQEMASMLVRALGLENEAKNRQNDYLSFKDASKIPAWARGAVVVAVEKGLVSGYSDNSFGPVRKASRAEAVTMIVKMMEVR